VQPRDANWARTGNEAGCKRWTSDGDFSKPDVAENQRRRQLPSLRVKAAISGETDDDNGTYGFWPIGLVCPSIDRHNDCFESASESLREFVAPDSLDLRFRHL